MKGGSSMKNKIEPIFKNVQMSKEELKKAHQELSLYRYNINNLKLKIEELEKYLENNVFAMALDEQIEYIKELIKNNHVEKSDGSFKEAKPSDILGFKIKLEMLEKEKEMNMPLHKNRADLFEYNRKLESLSESNLEEGIQSVETRMKILEKQISSGFREELDTEAMVKREEEQKKEEEKKNTAFG